MTNPLMKQFLAYLQEIYGDGRNRTVKGTRVTTPQMPVFMERESKTNMAQLSQGLRQLGAGNPGIRQPIQQNQMPALPPDDTMF